MKKKDREEKRKKKELFDENIDVHTKLCRRK